MSKDFPLYLLYGNESFLIEQTRKKILNDHAYNDHTNYFNLATFDMREVPVEEAVSDAETLPFMGEKRIVIITNPIFLTAEKETKIEHNVTKLEAYIKNPSSETVMIIEAPYEKLDERKKIVKALKKHAKVIHFPSLKDTALMKWLKTEAEEMHLSITEQALETLVRRVGTDLRSLRSELEKIELYVGETGEATNETIQQLVARSLEHDVFSLVDHVVNRRKNEAFRTLFDLLKQNEEPIKIVALLARQFRMIVQVKNLSQRGVSQKQIAASLKLHPYVVKLALEQGRHFSEADCFQWIETMAEVDYIMKSGQMDKSLALELLFANILAS